MKIYITLIALVASFYVYPCPITITNDIDQTVIVVDPRGPQAIFLAKQESSIIDPTIPNLVMRYILNEKLDIYFTMKDQPNVFYKKYRLTEKYCTDDLKENQLTISQILQFVQKPTDRFKVQEFQIPEKTSDHGNH